MHYFNWVVLSAKWQYVSQCQNLIAFILNKIRLKKVNRLIHEKNRDNTFFTILFDDPYDFAVQHSCVEFEWHKICKIVKSYDFTSKLSILTTMADMCRFYFFWSFFLIIFLKFLWEWHVASFSICAPCICNIYIDVCRIKSL